MNWLKCKTQYKHLTIWQYREPKTWAKMSWERRESMNLKTIVIFNIHADMIVNIHTDTIEMKRHCKLDTWRTVLIQTNALGLDTRDGHSKTKKYINTVHSCVTLCTYFPLSLSASTRLFRHFKLQQGKNKRGYYS